MIQKIYFVTKNKAKFYEAKKILEYIQNNFQEKKWELILFEMDLEEVQTNDVKKLVREKALTAFKRLKRIVLVEQTSLKIDAMGGLPGLQSAYILSGGKLDLKDVALEDIVSFCKMKKNFTAKAETNYCLCDGKNFYYGVGTVDGTKICSFVHGCIYFDINSINSYFILPITLLILFHFSLFLESLHYFPTPLLNRKDDLETLHILAQASFNIASLSSISSALSAESLSIKIILFSVLSSSSVFTNNSS